jgi:hypothetical protein
MVRDRKPKTSIDPKWGKRQAGEPPQVKCLISDEGHVWISWYDRLPAVVRRRLSNSPYNICPACMHLEAQEVAGGKPTIEVYNRVIEAIERELRKVGKCPMTDLKDLTDEQIAAELDKLGKERAAADEAYRRAREARWAETKRLADERDRRIIAQAATLSMKELNQILKQEGFSYEAHAAIRAELDRRREEYRRQKQIQENPPSKYDALSDDQLAGLVPGGLRDEEIVQVIRTLRGRQARMREMYKKLQEVEKKFDSAMTGLPPDLRTIKPLEPRQISGRRR